MRKLVILSVLIYIFSFSFAQNTNVWDGTTITPVTPDKSVYHINTGAELAWIAQQCNDGSIDFQPSVVAIEENIDLNNHEWTPIGNESHPFNGTVEGNSKVISNLKISGTNDNVGLFGYVKGYVSTKIVHVSNILIENVNVSGNNSVGGFVGYAQNYAFDSCYVINGTINGATGVGGFIGRCILSAATDCFSKVDVTASVTYGGGFVGINDTSDGGMKVYIVYSFAKGSVSGPGINGGFVGLNNSKVESAYSVTKSISGSTYGGFCGKNSSIGKFDNCNFCNSYNLSIRGMGENLGVVDTLLDMIGNTDVQMQQDGFVGTGSGSGLNGNDYGKIHWRTDLKAPQTAVNQKHPILEWYYTMKYDSLASITSHTNSSISVYPNPVKNELNLKFENIKVDKVEIVDLLGKPIITLKENFEFIDVNELNSGIYFVKVYSTKEIFTRKFIKQ